MEGYMSNLWVLGSVVVLCIVVYQVYKRTSKGRHDSLWSSNPPKEKDKYDAIGHLVRRKNSKGAESVPERSKHIPGDYAAANKVEGVPISLDIEKKGFTFTHRQRAIALLTFILVAVGTAVAQPWQYLPGKHGSLLSFADVISSSSTIVSVLAPPPLVSVTPVDTSYLDVDSIPLPSDTVQKVESTPPASIHTTKPFPPEKEKPKERELVLVRAEAVPNPLPVAEEVRKVTPPRNTRVNRETEPLPVKTKPVPKATLAIKAPLKDQYAACPDKYAGQYVEVQTVRVPAKTKEDIVVPRSGIRWVFPASKVGIVEGTETIYYKTDKVYRPLSKLPTSAFRFIKSFKDSPTTMVVCAIKEGN